jgi:hypothetical protein
MILGGDLLWSVKKSILEKLSILSGEMIIQFVGEIVHK